MPLVVGIRFKRAGRVYYFDPGANVLEPGDCAVLETSRGTEVGRVAIAPRQVQESDVTEPLKPVLRRATAADLLLQQHYKGQEATALERCRQEVGRHNLPMKLVAAEYNYDGSRLTFFFSSESRVDFRDLVKDLAGIFKTRIELRQVGVRDEAKQFGGVGRCGRTLCCAAFLGDFAQVSIRMAKDQDLPLNPMKISGCCGRLLCCLGYENELYCHLKQHMPKVGDQVTTHMGLGMVSNLNVLKGTVVVEMPGTHSRVEVLVEELASQAADSAKTQSLAPTGATQLGQPSGVTQEGGRAVAPQPRKRTGEGGRNRRK